MAKAGRRPKPKGEKVKSVGTYITDNEKKRIEKKFGSTTKAVRALVLPQCG